jgi:hypothetical protein
LEAIKEVVDLEKSNIQPQEKCSEIKPFKTDLLESLTEVIRLFQLKVLHYENDLLNKVTESGKLIHELQDHFDNN